VWCSVASMVGSADNIHFRGAVEHVADELLVFGNES
jgi:hypothetical protein